MLFKHADNDTTRKLKFDGWIMDPSCFQAFDDLGQSANLTVREYKLLEILTSCPRQVFTRDQLLSINHSQTTDITDRAIDTQITRIRRKLEAKSGKEIIESVRGIGYCFSAQVTPLNDDELALGST